MDFSPTNSYWKYLESASLKLDSETFSRVATSLEGTSWDDPTSAMDLNNCAVVALIEAEQCQDSSLREIYFEMALEALNRGVELYGDSLCAAHLALASTMTGEMEQGMQTAFSTFINTLQSAYVNNKANLPCLVYLPHLNSFTDSRHEKLIQILQSENSYTQSLLLSTEVLCDSALVFYNVTGLRFLHLASQLYPQSASIYLKLGISSLINNQLEGLLYLYRARKLAPDNASILQALYLAYRDLGQIESAGLWLGVGRDLSNHNSRSLDWQWTELEVESLVTYVPFETKLLLAVEPSLRSLVTSVMITKGDWFEKEMEFWRNWIKPGMTVIDVGANVGVYTFSAARRVGAEGCVLAVEPFSGCVRCLEETCKINQISWVKVCAGAASDHNGTVRLALNAANELNEVVSVEAEANMKPGSFEEVPCFTLDNLIEQENVTQVDFLKVDAEGHELQVLAGSDRLLTEFSPIILYENIAGNKGSNLALAHYFIDRKYQLFQYQPYLQRLIPINSTKDLEGRLNIIALPNHKASALGYKLDSFQDRQTPKRGEFISPSSVSYSPIHVFHSEHYQRHNQRRLEHLASIGLDIANATVLEVGAGIGDHTSFFLDRGCQVVSTEGRPENLEILRYRYSNLQVRYLDLDNPDPTFNEVFDIVYCYGLLYHLKKPAEAIEFMSRCCKKMLLLETCVSFGDEESINSCSEPAERVEYSISGQGCRPTRQWVYNQLKKYFAFVYMPITQPNHEEFPIDWTSPSSTQTFTRSVFIASRQQINNELLIQNIVIKQKRH